MNAEPTEGSSELESKVLDAFHCFQEINQLVGAHEDHSGSFVEDPFLRAIRHLAFLKEYFEVNSNGDDCQIIDMRKYAKLAAIMWHRPPHVLLSILGAVTTGYYASGELERPRITNPEKLS